nr:MULTISPECIES: RNA polymerase sigma factor [unclassified Frankia]
MSESAELSADAVATEGIPRRSSSSVRPASAGPASAPGGPAALVPAPAAGHQTRAGVGRPSVGEPSPKEPSVKEPSVEESDLSSAVSGARRGDEAAFRLLYRTIQPGLLRYLRVLVGDEAEDVASEAWLQIARDLPSFRGDFDGFRGWVATIARHRALDQLRRRSRRPRGDVPVETVMTEMAAPDDTAGEALEAMSTEAAMRLIAGLPLDQAEAVLLRVVMGLDAKTAGRVLGKRAGAVRTAAHRGLRRLAEQLGDGGGTGVGRPEAGEPGEHGRGGGARR